MVRVAKPRRAPSCKRNACPFTARRSSVRGLRPDAGDIPARGRRQVRSPQRRDGMAFAEGELVKVRSHHEALASIATTLPGLSTLVPFVVALWMRIKRTQVASTPPRKGDV